FLVPTGTFAREASDLERPGLALPDLDIRRSDYRQSLEYRADRDDRGNASHRSLLAASRLIFVGEQLSHRAAQGFHDALQRLDSRRLSAVDDVPKLSTAHA